MTPVEYLIGILGDEKRARWLARYKHRIERWFPDDKEWMVTREEVLREITDIEQVERETARDRNRVKLERPALLSDRGQGVVWDQEHDRQK